MSKCCTSLLGLVDSILIHLCFSAVTSNIYATVFIQILLYLSFMNLHCFLWCAAYVSSSGSSHTVWTPDNMQNPEVNPDSFNFLLVPIFSLQQEIVRRLSRSMQKAKCDAKGPLWRPQRVWLIILCLPELPDFLFLRHIFVFLKVRTIYCTCHWHANSLAVNSHWTIVCSIHTFRTWD